MKNLEAFIKAHTACHLVPVKNNQGKLEIGYGQTLGINAGTTWSQEQADADLTKSLRQLDNALAHAIEGYINYAFPRKAALISLAYDVGLEEIRKTKLIDYLAQGKFVLAHSLFLQFNKNGRAVSIKKTARRKSEQEMFNSKR